MSRLTDEEKEELLRAWKQESSFHSRDNQFCLQPDLAYRQGYIQFTSNASIFFKGKKPVRFEGKHWKL